MYYNQNERERRYAEQLRLAEPNPEFIARCLRGRSQIGVSISEDSHPNSDAAPGANGQPRQIPSPRIQTDPQGAVVATPARGIP